MPKIFCIEDDDEIRELILYALKSGGYDAEGYGCVADADPENDKPDLILLDIMLPEIDGITYLKQLKKNSRTKDIPVILITAKSSEIDKVIGLDEGADDYITKPFGVMELLSRIRAVLRRSGAVDEDVIKVGPVSIDLSARTATVGRDAVSLTMREFDVLAMLVKYAGKVVTRDMLMSSVWGYDFEGVTRTVDMHIKTIRQKLEQVGVTDYITTVRGVGYRVEKDKN